MDHEPEREDEEIDQSDADLDDANLQILQELEDM